MKNKILLIFFIISSFNFTFSQKVIQMNYENGTYTVPCKVNGIPMKFIFDTGASDVSISLTEAKFLIKQGLLDDSDLKGTIKYKIANGEIEEGTKINLKEINIDGFILENVEASIVHQQNAPLLLGQSAISKLGTFTMDGDKLIIQSSDYNELEFLGIDLTKEIQDFGLGRINLEEADPFVSIDFKYLKISDNHFLKDFQFDNQLVVFNKSGNIVLVILEKLTLGNEREKENTSKDIYNSLIQVINKKYWVTETTKARNTIWESENLKLILNIDNNKSVNIYFSPRTLRNLKTDFIQNKSDDFKSDNTSNISAKNKLREDIASIINNSLNDISKDDLKYFARTSNNNLEFHSEIKIDYEASKKNINILNEIFINNIMLQYFSTSDAKDMMLECDYDNLIFRTQTTDKNYKKMVIEKKISKKKLKDLKIPFTESEIINISE